MQFLQLSANRCFPSPEEATAHRRVINMRQDLGKQAEQ